MSTTDFWVYDVERGYLRLIEQKKERAEHTHYLYLKHTNITRIATGQPRLTKYTYVECWRAVNRGIFDPKEIKKYIVEAKRKLSESLGNPAPITTARKRRDQNRAMLHNAKLSKPSVSEPSVSVASTTKQPIAFESAGALMPPASTPTSASSCSIPDSEKSGVLIAPANTYVELEDAMVLSRLEEPEILKIAQMKICKHLLNGGENICYPTTDLSMDIALSIAGVPSEPSVLYDRLIQVATRRNVKFEPEKIYQDLKRAYGHVKYLPRLPSPECYQFSKY